MTTKQFEIESLKKFSIFKFQKSCSYADSSYMFLELKGNNFYFLKLPSFVRIKKSNSSIFFENAGGDMFQDKFNKFFSLLEDINFNNNKTYKLSLSLKGAGYTATISDCKTFLNLNIGFSNPVLIHIPTDKLKVSCEKNSITVEGMDKVFVGDFIAKIRKVKTPDAYKGKGFWLRNEIRPLKEIKKL
jgi:ribosomal protein L6P/L9E